MLCHDALEQLVMSSTSTECVDEEIIHGLIKEGSQLLAQPVLN